MVYNTEKRSEITALMSRNPDRVFTIEEISLSVAPDGRGKSTVYRIISKMVNEGLVRRISDGKTRRVTYQYLGCAHCSEHLHLKCTLCGALTHLECGMSEELLHHIESTHRFKVDNTATVLYGLCGACQKGRYNETEERL